MKAWRWRWRRIAPRLAALKQKLEANRKTTPLFDTARFTRNMEAAYEKMREDFLKKY